MSARSQKTQQRLDKLMGALQSTGPNVASPTITFLANSIIINIVLVKVHYLYNMVCLINAQGD